MGRRISHSKRTLGSESEHSPLVWEPGAVPAMKPFLQMETSEGDDIPQGLAKCYMNHTRLCSGNISLRSEWNSVLKTYIFKLRFLFLSTFDTLVVLFH